LLLSLLVLLSLLSLSLSLLVLLVLPLLSPPLSPPRRMFARPVARRDRDFGGNRLLPRLAGHRLAVGETIGRGAATAACGSWPCRYHTCARGMQQRVWIASAASCCVASERLPSRRAARAGGRDAETTATCRRARCSWPGVRQQ
jgi:hypothetical protein